MMHPDNGTSSSASTAHAQTTHSGRCSLPPDIIHGSQQVLPSYPSSMLHYYSPSVIISLPHSLFPFLFYFPYLHRWNPLFYIYLFHQNLLIHMPFLCFLHSLVHSFYLTSIASRLCTSLL